MIEESLSPSSITPEYRTSTLEIQLPGERVEVVVSTPGSSVGVGAILPILHQLSAVCEVRARAKVERDGKQISCRAGCGACCRQLVPISEIEARRLAQLVDDLPESRRSAVRSRFAAALERLEEAGLCESLHHLDEVPALERIPLSMSYFRLGIPCPFLEAESCSIHSDRPLSCREYMVISRPENCAAPTAETIEMVEMPARISKALRGIGKSTATGSMPRVALVLALEFAATQPDTPVSRPPLEWLTSLLQPLHVRPVDSAEQPERAGISDADRPLLLE
jgi:Fe-S-cluster containining protein